MEEDIPQLIERSQAYCSELEDSIKKTAGSVENLATMVAAMEARLNATQQDGESTMHTSDTTLNHLDGLLDQLLKELTTQLESVGSQVNKASLDSTNSFQAVGTSFSLLEVQGAQTVMDNSSRHQLQEEATDGLQADLSKLLAGLDQATKSAIQDVTGAHQGVSDKHTAVGKAGQVLEVGFTSFHQGVERHSGSIQTGLNGAAALTQKDLDRLQADLQLQFKQACDKVKSVLDKTSTGLSKDADNVEHFLGELLKFLTSSRSLVHDRMNPPVEMINNCFKALQPIINLMGTLRDLGLL